jgi:4-amino-4-deoxy-L-arabinose transferase-like glycosyltransferase
MDFLDFLIAPIYVFFLTMVAYLLRPYLTNQLTKRYFIPALAVRFFGAFMLGIIYQFYYGGGDTLNFYHLGSAKIFNAFINEPLVGLSLIFGSNEVTSENFQYVQGLLFLKDTQSYFLIRIAAIFGIFAFNSYLVVSFFFAAYSFSGLWALYHILVTKYPEMYKWFALSILFIPSVFFWGSGYLKDTLCIGALGWATYCLFRFADGKSYIKAVFGMLFSLFLIYSVKPYIVICFFPAMLLFLFFSTTGKIKSTIIKMVFAPLMIVFLSLSGYFMVDFMGKKEEKYALDNIAETARVTAYDIRYYTGKDAGSGYSLGELDGSFLSLVKLAPQAVNVSLFRPYIWEVRNPLMLLSALESLVFFLLTIYAVILVIQKKIMLPDKSLFIFLLTFSVLFAFAVGVSTYNFGTLSRYKIPMMPFYLTAIVFLLKGKNKVQKI